MSVSDPIFIIVRLPRVTVPDSRIVEALEQSIRFADHWYKDGHAEAMAPNMDNQRAVSTALSAMTPVHMVEMRAHRVRNREAAVEQAAMWIAEIERTTGLPFAGEMMICLAVRTVKPKESDGAANDSKKD